ncbi:MAG: 60S ribosomal protein L31 [Candidatus Aenigmarchaeota archaeon]|nr:60S ribosomal protein L31 [Candidatus Aenigmarchaeota archaeon]
MAKTDVSDKERMYIVNLRNGFRDVSGPKRGRAAMRYLRAYFEKNLGDVSEVKVSQGVNHYVLKKGVKNPAHKIKVKVMIDDETAKIMLPDEKEAKKKKIRKIKKQDTKSKLQEMLASKTAAPQKAAEEKKESPKKSAEENFEEQVQVDKKSEKVKDDAKKD